MTAKQECEQLTNELIPMAKNLLADHGEFYPFGGYIKNDGELAHAATQLGNAEYPKPSELIRLMKQHLAALVKRRDCRATAMVFDVRIQLPGSTDLTEAIQINLDHQDSYSLQVFFTYTKDPVGNIAYGRVFAQPGDGLMFTQASA